MKRQIEVEQSVFVVRCGSNSEVTALKHHFRFSPAANERYPKPWKTPT
jgi:hypothetical protein